MCSCAQCYGYCFVVVLGMLFTRVTDLCVYMHAESEQCMTPAACTKLHCMLYIEWRFKCMSCVVYIDGLLGLGVLGGALLVGGAVTAGAVALAGIGIAKLVKK